MNYQKGVSFIELIFALSVAGILVSVAVPNFVGSMRNSDMASTTNALVGAVHAARSEAVKSRGLVTLCRGDVTGANPVCDTSANGLLVFINASNDATYDAANDTLIRSTPWLQDDMTVQSTGIPGYITFNARGTTQDVNGDPITGTSVLCGPSGDQHARVVSLSPTGRPTVQHHRDATNPPACPTS